MKKHFIKTVILLPILLSSLAHAALMNEKVPYYGEEFYQELNAGVSDKDLAARLKTVLKAYHTPLKGAPDQITNECAGPKCYVHSSIGYDSARKFLFGSFYLFRDRDGYGVKDVYCDRNPTGADFKNGSPPGPGVVPDPTVINAEHTWPQSRFTGKYRVDQQKADLHHLFPTDSQMNSIRGNNPFGEVVKDKEVLRCKNVRIGRVDGGNQVVFEPPREHRGNVARALFYFSTRYDLPIDSKQESFMRKWHREDPVDEEEAVRNQRIYELQNNRNPFIDHPELVDKILDF